ncbi:MAG: glycosyltransferase, partial [Alistipes sp.]|nr:glycosyltransferase [Alistipes sp.]
GCGIPMIEAACCGVPAVVAVGSCLEEAGGPDAVYVDPDDPQELADRLTEILADEALRRRMSERGRAYVGRFEPEKLAADMLAVYDKTIQQQKNER